MKIKLVPSMLRRSQRVVDVSIKHLRELMELRELLDDEKSWVDRVKAIDTEEAKIRDIADKFEGIDVSALDALPW